MMAELEMKLLLPTGTIIYPHAGTTIDLVWGNDEAANRLIKCQIAEKHDYGSDHLPIATTIDMKIEKAQFSPSYNYDKTNWKEPESKLKAYLPDITSSAERQQHAQRSTNLHLISSTKLIRR
jgi:hypothetical protein